MHFAADGRHVDVIRALVAAGADVETSDVSDTFFKSVSPMDVDVLCVGWEIFLGNTEATTISRFIGSSGAS